MTLVRWSISMITARVAPRAARIPAAQNTYSKQKVVLCIADFLYACMSKINCKLDNN